MTIDSELITNFVEYQVGVVTAFIPLFGAISGVFIAFAIAHSLRFFVQKLVK